LRVQRVDGKDGTVKGIVSSLNNLFQQAKKNHKISFSEPQTNGRSHQTLPSSQLADFCNIE
jgi:hypothetical protein